MAQKGRHRKETTTERHGGFSTASVVRTALISTAVVKAADHNPWWLVGSATALEGAAHLYENKERVAQWARRHSQRLGKAERGQEHIVQPIRSDPDRRKQRGRHRR